METPDWNYLLVAAGILIAILSLWAQLWVGFGGNKDNRDDVKLVSATLGLFWIYMAILIAMIGLALVLVGRYWEGGFIFDTSEICFGFIMTSFIMGLANIFESTLSIFLKGRRNKTAFDPRFEHVPELKCRLVKLVGFALSLLLVSCLGVALNHLFWLGYVAILIWAVFEYVQLHRH